MDQRGQGGDQACQGKSQNLQEENRLPQSPQGGNQPSSWSDWCLSGLKAGLPKTGDTAAMAIAPPPQGRSQPPQEENHVPHGESQSPQGEDQPPSWRDKCISGMKTYGPSVAVGAAAVIITPAAISAAGFTAGGIAAGSAGAKAMSVAATSGIGMPVVSALQSAGAAGLAATTKVFIGATGAGATSRVQSYFRGGNPSEKEKGDTKKEDTKKEDTKKEDTKK